MRKTIFIIAVVIFFNHFSFLTHNVLGEEITRKDTTDITDKFPDPNFRKALFQLKIIADPEHILAHEHQKLKLIPWEESSFSTIFGN